MKGEVLLKVFFSKEIALEGKNKTLKLPKEMRKTQKSRFIPSLWKAK